MCGSVTSGCYLHNKVIMGTDAEPEDRIGASLPSSSMLTFILYFASILWPYLLSLKQKLWGIYNQKTGLRLWDAKTWLDHFRRAVLESAHTFGCECVFFSMQRGGWRGPCLITDLCVCVCVYQWINQSLNTATLTPRESISLRHKVKQGWSHYRQPFTEGLPSLSKRPPTHTSRLAVLFLINALQAALLHRLSPFADV